MSVLAAVAIFPVLTLMLVALMKAETMISGPAEKPLSVVTELVADALNDAPTGDALPVPQPRLRLVEADENLAA